jgi:hypothetical protein
MEDGCALAAIRSFLDDEDCWVLRSFGMLGLAVSWIKSEYWYHGHWV